MPALTDSRWVAEDLAAATPPRGTLTVSADVEAFTPDVNDPDVSAYSGEAPPDRGTRTAWAKLILPDDRNVTLDATDSDDAVNVLVVVWSVGQDGALAHVADGYGDSPLANALAAGTYLVEFSQLGRSAFGSGATAVTPTITETYTRS
jgi:hypothetical protein